MATITNVTLNLQSSGSPAPSSSRTATVTFTTRFSLFEVQGGALYTADVRLQAVDGSVYGNPTLVMGSATVRATGINVETTLTNVFTRSTLDEDRDYFIWYDMHGHPHVFSQELVDQWRARVILTPVIQTISRNSPIVSGSWGHDGND